MATGVFVRSFTGHDHTEGSPHSSEWVRVKGEETTPNAAGPPAPIPGASADADLGELSLPYWGSLEPAFDPAVTEYTVRFTEEQGRRYTNFYLKALPADAGATVTVNGWVMQEAEVSVSGTPTFESPVTILVMVTAADGATTKIYTLTTSTAPAGTPEPEPQEQTPPESEPEQQAQVAPPGAVVNLQVLAEANRLTVTWEAPATGGAPERYTVHLKPADGGKGRVKRPDAARTSFTFKNLEPGATYRVSVRAENAAGKGARTNADVTLPAATPPAGGAQGEQGDPPPQPDPQAQQRPPASCPVETAPPVPGQTEPYNVCVTPGDGTLTVTWTVAPREGVSGDSIRHALRWSQVAGVWANPKDPKAVGPNDGVTVEGGVASYTITGLENGVATGVFVRSFTGGNHNEGAPPVERLGAHQGRQHHAQDRRLTGGQRGNQPCASSQPADA